MKILQVLPSVARRVSGEVQLDVDFHEALAIYLDHFDHVKVACPITETDASGTGLERCKPVNDLDASKFSIIELPNAYSPKAFFKDYARVKSLLRRELERADCLIASPHTLIGDWPTVAIRQAQKLRKPYVVEADVVYESVARNGFSGDPDWKQFLKERMVSGFRRGYEKSLKSAKLALFQGKTVFDAYSPYCNNAHKVEHHIPIYGRDHVTQDQLDAKLQRIQSGAPLRICYAGRLVSMKGPLDWVNTIHELIKCGIDLEATWLGDGPLLPIVQKQVAAAGIANKVRFPGYVSNRSAILDAIRSSDILLFCHKTEESARILGEALACGCPIVGYASAYPVDLTAEYGGGLFSGLGDWSHLADHIQRLDLDREALCSLVYQAARSGSRFDRTKLLTERMMLVKRYVRAPSEYRAVS